MGNLTVCLIRAQWTPSCAAALPTSTSQPWCTKYTGTERHICASYVQYWTRTRVLNDTGIFMEISYGTPDCRLPHLQHPSLRCVTYITAAIAACWFVRSVALDMSKRQPPLPSHQLPSCRWQVEVCILQRGAPTSPDDPVRPVSIAGPFDCSDKDLMAQLEEHTDVHFVYVCTKQQ